MLWREHGSDSRKCSVECLFRQHFPHRKLEVHRLGGREALPATIFSGLQIEMLLLMKVATEAVQLLQAAQ